MHDNLIKKMVIFSILVLLIGVTVAPSISGNTKKISNMQDVDNAENEKLISDQKTWMFPDARVTPLDWPTGPGATGVVSTESTEESWSPSLDIDSSGTVHVAWWDSTNYYDPNSGSCGSDYDIFNKENSGTSYNSIERGIIIAFGQGTLDTGTGQYNFNYGLLQFIGFAGGGPPFSYSDSAFTWTEGQYTPENYIGFSLQFGSFVIIIRILLTGGTINGTSYT